MTRNLSIISNVLLIIAITTFVVHMYYGFVLYAPMADVVAFHGGMLTINYQTVHLWELCHGATAAVSLVSTILGAVTAFLEYYNEYLDECELY